MPAAHSRRRAFGARVDPRIIRVTGVPRCLSLRADRPCASGDRYLYAGLGTTLGVGANPRPESDRNAANVLDEGDLLSYRTLLATSDDLEDSGAEAVRLAQIQ